MTDRAVPSPMRLWCQAYDEFGEDDEARAARYLDLMREHGHIVKAAPGEDSSLPCGWPNQRRLVDDSDIMEGSEFDGPHPT